MQRSREDIEESVRCLLSCLEECVSELSWLSVERRNALMSDINHLRMCLYCGMFTTEDNE